MAGYEVVGVKNRVCIMVNIAVTVSVYVINFFYCSSQNGPGLHILD